MDKRYQVFISSTFVDLEDERKKVMEAIINLNCFPAGMEMFPASDTEQFDYIKSIIDESDYYVIIVAGKYGSVAEDGISYTEKEFDYAKEKGVPILAFVKKDIVSIPGYKIETDPDKREKLSRFKERVLKGRVAEFWDSADELKYKIHNSLSNEFKIHPRTGWIRGNQENSEELLSEINKLRKENERLKKDLSSSKSDDKNNQVSVKFNKQFEVQYYKKAGDKSSTETIYISTKEIIQKIGAKLIEYVDYNEFRVIVNDLIINTQKQKNENKSYIIEESLEDIKIKLLALQLIQINSYSSIKLSEVGRGVYFELIEF